ncbi:glycosyltransferase [Lewinella sp. 4G2]|uniref:glycosyltransferase n=1 Tax=Lewinella sp. 4G2 TaxID=1803372 RepID=UPI00097713C0|nr:glycosyltransferase [Lewinella sp. 4G2]
MLAPLRFPIAEPYAGGLEAHTHQLAIGLRELGHEVTLFAHPDSDSSFPIVPFSLDENPSFWESLKAYRTVIRRLKEGGYDLIQNNTIHFFPPLMARFLSVPMVTTRHTPPYRSHQATAGMTCRVKNHRYVSISHHIARVWEVYGGVSTVIHNGVDLERFSTAVAAPSSPTETQATEKTAIWYGRILPDKGTHFAAMAARAAGFSLQIVGTIDDQDYFDREVAPLLNNQIQYLGRRTQSELASLVAAASVGLVTPQWEEPFGLVCIEMLACGTPVAAFRNGAIPEIIDASCGRLVDQADTEALARVLSEVAKLPPTACRARAEEFSLKTMVQRYANLYGSLVNN